MVVAPSMIPRKSGERQKNDKRDAAGLAVLHRGGLLTAVWVPDAAHEAMRDLIRVRWRRCGRSHGTPAAECVSATSRADLSSNGRTVWTKAHRGWLADQSLPAGATDRAGGKY